MDLQCSIKIARGKQFEIEISGHDGQTRLRSCEVYCRETNQWTLMKSMITRRSDADACEFDGKIYIFGAYILT